jgi:chemosensory pili system protein ChpA (sensor histidine kinase/response regulator)
MSFSIDQVRETFTADVNRLLGEILDATDAVMGTPPSLPADIGGRPAFDAMGDAGHALLGTTRLVGVTSLSESARVLEETSRAGQEAVRQLLAQATRVRALAEVASEGALQMKEMLALELAKKGEEALRLSMAWQARAAAALEDRGTAPVPVPVEAPPAPDGILQEFEFDEAAAQAPQVPAGAPRDTGEEGPREEFAFGESVIDAGPLGFEDELLGVFQEEVRSTLPGLADRLAELRRDPADLVNLSALERHYHTMKGAAATVRLREVSAAAARLDDQLSEMLEAGAGPTPSIIDALIADTNAMLALAHLPALDLPAAASPGAATAEARRLFFEEGRELLSEARALAKTLSTAAGSELERVRSDLERLFHRWKGSALIVGEREMAALAEAGQRRLEAPGTDTGALGRETILALGRLESLLGPANPSTMAGSIDEGAPRREAAREAVSVDTKGELWEAFQVEANDLLESMEAELLVLEDSPQPKTGLETVMRHVHTLKGVVNTVGLSPTGKLLHAVEDFLETLVAAPILPPLRKVTTLLLEVRDGVRRNFRQAREGQVEALLPLIEARVARLLGGRAPASGVLASAREEGASIHSLESARSRRSLRAGTGPGDGAERKFVRVATERLDSLMNLAGELVVSRSRLLARASSLRDIQQELGRGSRRLLESVEAFREEHEFANLDGRRVRREVAVKAAQQRAAAGSAEAFGGFGELELDHYDDVHILSRSLAEITSDFGEMNGLLAKGLASLADDSDSFDKLVSGIQSEVTRARMVPLEVLFTRLRFPVRDAADREAKDVRVTTVGADVALDKTIADALLQPMLHLVRNSVVHGIESPTLRERAGKARAGAITLTARQQAGQIGIEVRDDGGGLDLAALRQRGVAMGLISPDVELDDPAVRELVFQPGLTTRAQAGAVSGRGVGCDVVRRAVQRLGGSIRVESESGRGTAFLITLPVSLAITKALVVRARGRSYAVPLHFAERIVDREESSFVESAGVRRIRVGDELLPVSTFEQHFGEKRPSGPGRAVLLLRVGDHRHALEVDAVTGQEEIVVKALGPFLAGHPLFAGVTVRGSGELVLILDVAGLIAGAQRGVKARPADRPARAAQPARGAAPARPVPAPASSASGARAIRALFVDDSLSVRKFAEITLKALGVDVTLAIDGVDGLNKLRDGAFDVVFTDLEMPRMHGFELIGELRFLPAYKDLPIIVVTSRSGQKHQQQARAVGATDYLTKPFSAQMLAAALKRWVRKAGEGPGQAGKTP